MDNNNPFANFIRDLGENLKGMGFPRRVVFYCMVLLFILASPYVIRQMQGLTKFGDYIYNITLDLLIMFIALLVAYILGRLLKKLDEWLKD